MSLRRRELRVRLRSDRVGHAAVIEWLDTMERDGRGVAGLQARVIEVLSQYLGGEPAVPPAQPPRTDPAPITEPAARPVQRSGRSAVVALKAREEPADDPLTLATERLRF